MSSEYDYLFTFALIGNVGVGKHTVLFRFDQNTYVDTRTSSRRTNHVNRKINLNGEIIKVTIILLEQPRHLITLNRGFCQSVIFVYDVTVQRSFNNLKQWLENDSDLSPMVSRMIVGNKYDLTTNKVVDYETAKTYADSLHIPLLEISAKDGTNFEHAFKSLVTIVRSSMPLIQSHHPEDKTNGIFDRISSIFKSDVQHSMVMKDASSTSHQCVECQNSSSDWCMHCSKQVCMNCAKQHVILANDQMYNIQKVLDDKIIILDRLSTIVKERINAEYDRILTQANTDRDQAYAQINQLIEEYKQQIRENNSELNQLPVNEASAFARRMNSEFECINEDNNQIFCVATTLPKIQVQHKR